MATAGGFGLVVKIRVGTVLTTIQHVIDGDMPEFENVVAEITGHDATGGYSEHIASGKKNNNSFTLTLAWDAKCATHAAIVTAQGTGTAVGMSVADPAANETITFNAIVQKIARTSKQDGALEAVVTFQPTGVPTIA